MTGTFVIWSVKWVTSVIWSVKWVMHPSRVWGIETGVYNVAWCSNRCRIRLSCILHQPELLCSVTSSSPWPPLCFLQFCKLTTTAPRSWQFTAAATSSIVWSNHVALSGFQCGCLRQLSSKSSSFYNSRILHRSYGQGMELRSYRAQSDQGSTSQW